MIRLLKDNMEVMKEFLEASTIHGLIYISTAKVGTLTVIVGLFDIILFQTKIGKFVWCLIVCLGFIGTVAKNICLQTNLFGKGLSYFKIVIMTEFPRKLFCFDNSFGSIWNKYLSLYR